MSFTHVDNDKRLIVLLESEFSVNFSQDLREGWRASTPTSASNKCRWFLIKPTYITINRRYLEGNGGMGGRELRR